MPIISVIIPIYKVEQYLERCLESVLNQSFESFEIILVDDGSPDDSGRLCDQYALKDNRVHVIHKLNGGAADARNVALDWVFANSNSEWITFIDSDDWVHKRYLESLYNAVQETGYNISICSFENTYGEQVDVDTETMVTTSLNTEEFYVEQYINSVVPWGKLYRKQCFKNRRFPLVKMCEDEFLIYRVLFAEKSVAFVDKPLYFYFQNCESVMHTPWSEQRMVAFDAFDEQIEYFLANHYIKAARLTVRNYLSGVQRGLKQCHQQKPRNKYAIRLYKERKKRFSIYIKHLDVNNPSDQWILVQVRPIRTRIRLYMKAVKNRLKRIRKSEK